MVIDNLSKKYIPSENSFYKNYYHYFLGLIIALIALLLVVIVVVFYQVTHIPLPVFTAAQPDGKTLSLTSSSEPNLLPNTILEWASTAATRAYTFSFEQYNEQLALARPYFTDDGWQDYLNSVRYLIDTIVQKQVFVNGVVAGTPVISNQGPLPDKGYVWRVQIPFLVTYQSTSGPEKRNYYVVLSIVRVPTEVNPRGIGIDQFVMR